MRKRYCRGGCVQHAAEGVRRLLPDPASPSCRPLVHLSPSLGRAGRCMHFSVQPEVSDEKHSIFHGQHLRHICSVVMTKKKPTMAQAFQSQRLSSGWSFKQTDTEDWLPVARVPTNVHLDLLDHDKYSAA